MKVCIDLSPEDIVTLKQMSVRRKKCTFERRGGPYSDCLITEHKTYTIVHGASYENIQNVIKSIA